MRGLGAIIFLLLIAPQARADAAAGSPEDTANFAPPSSVVQSDPSLSDLFNPNTGKSELCMPTTLANIFAWQSAWRNPSFPRIALAQSPASGRYAQEVRALARLCHTNLISGTTVASAAACVRQLYRQSGYPQAWAYVIGSGESTDPTSVSYWHGQAPLTIDDIRYFAGKEVGIMLDVQWEAQAGMSWQANGGHAVMIAGYDYDFSWGTSRIDLKVVNPNTSYAQYPQGEHYDTVSMTSAEASPDVEFPPGFTYTLSGMGFSNPSRHGFVKNILVFFPDSSVQP